MSNSNNVEIPKESIQTEKSKKKNERLVLIEERSWGELIDMMSEQCHDIDAYYVLLTEIVEAKNVCKDNHCPIHDKLDKVGQSRMNFKYKSIEDAEKGLKDNVTTLEHFKHQYKRYIYYVNECFNLMRRTATNRNTIIYEEEQYHVRNIDTIDHLLKSKTKVPWEVFADLNLVMKRNSRMGDVPQKLRQHQEDLENKKKKKDDEEEEDEDDDDDGKEK